MSPCVGTLVEKYICCKHSTGIILSGIARGKTCVFFSTTVCQCCNFISETPLLTLAVGHFGSALWEITFLSYSRLCIVTVYPVELEDRLVLRLR